MEEEVVEVATKVAFSFKPAVVAAVGIASAAAGAAVSWFATKKIYKTRFEALAAVEIAEAREYYERQNKAGRFATPESAAEALGAKVSVSEDQIEIPEEAIEAFKVYAGDPRPPLTENIFQREPVPERSLVETSEKFTSPIPGSPGPYVITEDEYADGEVGYNRVSLTYYAADDTLADEDEAPIFEVRATVGDALDRFGEGSGSAGPDTVFVRNSRISLDFEITRSSGSYGTMVAGNDLKHSYEPIHRGRRRLRDE